MAVPKNTHNILFNYAAANSVGLIINTTFLINES